MYMTEVVGRYLARWPRARILVFVRDISVEVEEPTDELAVAGLQSAWAWLIVEVQEGLR